MKVYGPNNKNERHFRCNERQPGNTIDFVLEKKSVLDTCYLKRGLPVHIYETNILKYNCNP